MNNLIKLLLLFAAVLVSGCVENQQRYQGIIVRHGEEHELKRIYRRYEAPGWRMDSKVFTQIRLKDGSLVKIPTVIGEIDQEVSVWAYPSEVEKEERE